MTKDNDRILQWAEYGVYLKKTSCPGEMFCVELANPPRIAECGLVFLFSQTGPGWGLAGVQAKLSRRRGWARKAFLALSHPDSLTAFSLLPPALIGKQWPGSAVSESE